MQARCALFQQALAESGYDILAERADRSRIFPERLQPLAYPARNLCAAGIGKPGQLMEVRDGHDAGYHWDIDGILLATVDKAEIGIRVIEVLGNCTVGPGIDLAFEVCEIARRAACLGVKFRIRGNLDMKVVSGFPADELYQFIGMAEFSCLDHA